MSSQKKSQSNDDKKTDSNKNSSLASRMTNSMSMMTPRNLAIAQPARSAYEMMTPRRVVAVVNEEVGIENPTKANTSRSKSGLAGYTDRAALRRGDDEDDNNDEGFEDRKGLDLELVRQSKVETVEKSKEKVDSSDILGSCKSELAKKICTAILDDSKPPLKDNLFIPSRMVYSFKSLEESKKGPFDPLHLPTRILRSTVKKVNEFDEDESKKIMERIGEVIKGFRQVQKKTEHYLEQVKSIGKTEEEMIIDDIFPDAGTYEAVKSTKSNYMAIDEGNEEVSESILELIAKKSGKDEGVQEQPTGQSLFGYDDILPKLSRLKGDQGSIAFDFDESDPMASGSSKMTENDNDYDEEYEGCYPGMLESAGIEYDDDDEEEAEGEPKGKLFGKKRGQSTSSVSGNGQKKKFMKETAQVEKIMSSKYGMNLKDQK